MPTEALPTIVSVICNRSCEFFFLKISTSSYFEVVVKFTRGFGEISSSFDYETLHDFFGPLKLSKRLPDAQKAFRRNPSLLDTMQSLESNSPTNRIISAGAGHRSARDRLVGFFKFKWL